MSASGELIRSRGLGIGLGIMACLLALVLPAVILVPTADAHAELRESSPAAGQTVGGEFHQVALHFGGLAADQPQQVRLYDPAGNLLRENPARFGQRLVLSIDPLTVPGEYLVVIEVNGIDGDFTTESFTFQYDPAADEPSPISIELAEEEGFDFINFALLLAFAAAAAFLVHRFAAAWREHRAAQRSADSAADDVAS